MSEQKEKREDNHSTTATGDESEEDVALEECNLLEEPTDFYRAPPQPKVVEYALDRGTGAPAQTLRFHLVASHPLWAHYLWNGGRHIAGLIARGALPVAGRRVLEFGAGAAVPSVVAALCGAAHVAATDFPEEPLLAPIRRNVAENIADPATRARVAVHGFLWGADPTPLLRSGIADTADGAEDAQEDAQSDPEAGKYDVLLLGDLLANHTALPDLARSVAQLMRRPRGTGVVAFSHHRPWLADRDLAIFAHLRRLGVESTQVAEVAADPMFAEDPGSLEVRRTIHVYKIFWPDV